MPANVSRNVLLVEDNSFEATLVQRLLARSGKGHIRVEVATRLQEGIERLDPGNTDAILLDLHLPDSDGLATFHDMHRAATDVPIIIMTGTDDDEIAAEAMREGAQDFLVKGTIDGRLLVRSIRYAVERQQARNQRRSDEERYRNIFHASHDAIYVTSMDGALMEFNGAALTLFGHGHETLAGMQLGDLCSDPEQWERFDAALTASQSVKHYELQFQRADHTKIDCIVTSVVRHDERGIPCGYQGTIRDVTEHNKLQRELAQAQKLESIGRLAAGIAHEINTPIQYVSDNTRFLVDACTKVQPILEQYRATVTSETTPQISEDEIAFLLEQIPSALEESLEGLDRVATIVRAMKEFSHPGTKDAQPIDLNKALESTITVSRNEWKHLADVVTDFDRNLPAVTGHVNQLNQVFLNIIVNAAHAIGEQGSREKGTITITTRQAGDAVEISIADNGPGMPDSIKAKIFDPFFTTKEVGKGTGQGLAVARSVVVDKHEGTMEVNSELGIGTTFTIRLPMVPVEEFAQPMAIGL